MKKVIWLLVFLISAGSLFAYDYREVIFGNDYERITECTDSNIIEKLTDDINSDYDKSEIQRGRKFQRVFEEHYDNVTIYRVLNGNIELTDENLSQMLTNYINLFQEVAFIKNNNTYVVSKDYIYIRRSGDGTTRSWNEDYFYGLSIISRNNKIIGMLEYNASDCTTHHSSLGNDGYSWEITEKSCEANFIYWNDILNDSYYLKNVWHNCFDLDKDRVNKISIDYSFPLIDSKRPFMYMIQNAFDDNPSTSYVEDTEDSNISIELYSSALNVKCTKLKIINGYAKNSNLYSYNNRIKKIVSTATSSTSAILQDNTLTPQIISWDDFNIASEELYRGSRYDDTCIAEVDFQKEDGSWVFGE